MKEDKDDAERTDVTHSKEEYGEDALSVRAPVGKLVVSHLTWDIPAHKQTS